MTSSIRNIAPIADFGFDLLRKQVAANRGKNVFMCPLSISLNLAMVANGAAGDTLAEMIKALRAPDYGDDFRTNNVGYENLIASLTGRDTGASIKIANSIWAAQSEDITFNEKFLRRAQDYLDGRVFKELFSDPSTVTKINDWVKKNTEGKIESIVEQIDPSAVMMLLSAVHFKGEFAEKFDKGLTHGASFKGVDGEKTVQMMQRMGDYRFYRGVSFDMIALPFGKAKNRFSLYVLLPKDGKNAEFLVEGLNDEAFRKACGKMRPVETQLYLPKFELEAESELKELLIAQGMEKAFGGNADFSRLIEGAQKLRVSKVTHKVFARVDEEGAEAAAVTKSEIVTESICMTQLFRVDRPFVTIIADEDTGAVAFTGLINDPQAPKA